MTALNRIISAGLQEAYYAFVDSSGNLIGSTPTRPAAGNQTGSGPTRLFGVKTLPTTIQSPDIVPVTGDDGVRGTFTFKSGNANSVTLGIADSDSTLIQYLEGTLVETNGDTTMTLNQPLNPVYADVGLWFIQQAKSTESATLLAASYESRWFGRSQMVNLDADLTERAASDYSYQLTVNQMGLKANGVALTTGANGDTSALYLGYKGTTKTVNWTWTGNGVVTEFTLPTAYPVSAASATYFSVSINNVLQVITTNFTLTTTAVTFGVAPANNAVIQAQIWGIW
jgi:hypothetical protein